MGPEDQFGQRISFGLSRAIEPRLMAAPVEPQAYAIVAPTAFPLVTCALVAALALIFIGECASGFASGPGRGIETGGLIAFGGISGHLALSEGEWWRLATASLLHANFPHIVGNAVVLLLGGYYLERLVGHAWFTAVYALSGLGGALASALLNDSVVVSVGASGAIMGVLAVLGACSLHTEALEQRRRIQRIVLFLVIPSIVPFGAATGSPVDFNAHLGGTTVGVIMGFVLLVFWPETGEAPRFRRVAAVVGVTGMMAGLIGLGFVAANFQRYAAEAHLLMTDSEARKDLKDRPEALVALYPHDPLARLALGAKLMEFNPAAAERESRAGLREERALAVHFPPEVRLQLKGVLAFALFQQNRLSEGVEAARDVCTDQSKSLSGLRDELTAASLCRQPPA